MSSSRMQHRTPLQHEDGIPLRISLGSLAHDPQGRLLRPFEEALPVLLSIFDQIGVVITPSTTPEWIERVGRHDRLAVIRSKHDEIGENRREALSLVLSTGVEAIQYTDLDRVIHWALTRPSELSKVAPLAARRKYTIIGRSEAALATHPVSQRLPEIVTNRAISALLGRDIDITSGCCTMSRDATIHILELSKASGVTTDAEWPTLAALVLGYDVAAVTADGLDFETADYYGEEVQQAGGLANWIHSRYETIAVWEARVAAAEATIRVAALVAMRHPEVLKQCSNQRTHQD